MTKKITVIHPAFTGTLGGAKSVAFTLLECLSNEGYDVEFYSEHNESIEEINSHYDLNIKEEKIDRKIVSEPLPSRLLDKTGRFTLLKHAIRQKKFAEIAHKASKDADIVFFTSKLWKNKLDYNCPTLQYVHKHMPNSKTSDKILPYRKILNKYPQPELHQTDKILYNSDFTKSKSKKDGIVVYPPVKDDFKDVKWKEKKNRAIIAGRIAPDKKTIEAIEIMENTELDLLVAGISQNKEYLDKVQERAEHKDWLEIKTNLTKKNLNKEIEDSKIGINCSREEDFGISVVEYMKANTIPIVYNNGGPKEIVQYDQFKYEDVDEASQKIRDNLSTPESCLNKIKKLSDSYSEEKFKEDVLRQIED